MNKENKDDVTIQKVASESKTSQLKETPNQTKKQENDNENEKAETKLATETKNEETPKLTKEQENDSENEKTEAKLATETKNEETPNLAKKQENAVDVETKEKENNESKAATNDEKENKKSLNKNFSASKSATLFYDEAARNSFSLPVLPFSVEPVHFSFESSMKFDGSIKAPQFKALPIPKLQPADVSIVSSNPSESQTEKLKENEIDHKSYDDTFGIIDAFQSISSSSSGLQNRQNRKQVAIEKPSITGKIEDMKCFSLFKKYLESNHKL